jgi:hypothetical protein
MTDSDKVIDGWPANIVADRHEVSGKWVLMYLTDEQAALCKKALPHDEVQCDICGDYHKVDKVPYTCQTGDGI